ncbi:ABC transporter permease [Kovacikia minuta CCNUW1]|uniref:ABC transporter permease n=1 Tax=Kovacikia minuta TaxID=2931930 RepID=UPI001CCFCD10|nr:ABC transporter permease [Kovacikia minuta]UBF24078.1 ABC transporter permease [Kovacikia minuta CCNUW1]
MRIILANIVAIYRRELQSYFASPLAYVVAGIFWVLAGIFFVQILLGPNGVIQGAALADLQSQQLGTPAPPIDAAAILLRFFLQALGFIALFILPILSMGLYAEERKRGTLELLATSPITNWAVALGKLLAVVTFFATMVLPLLVYQAIALSATNPPFNPVVVLLGYGGLLLLAASVLSLGMFISSLTSSTILAAILTFALVLLLWMVDSLSKGVGGPVGAVLGHLSLLKHYENLTQGILDTSSLVLFASYIILGLFLTAQSIEAFKFQRS